MDQLTKSAAVRASQTKNISKCFKNGLFNPADWLINRMLERRRLASNVKVTERKFSFGRRTYDKQNPMLSQWYLNYVLDLGGTWKNDEHRIILA